MSNEGAREVARNLVRYWETTGDSVRFHYEYEKDIAGAIAAYGREEAGKARHEMNQQIGEYLHQPANSKSTLQMLEDGLREERGRALEQGFRFGWGASMSDMHWHEAIQKCRALAQRETQANERADTQSMSADLLAAAREGCDKLSILAGNRIPITALMVEAVAAAFRPIVDRLERQLNEVAVAVGYGPDILLNTHCNALAEAVKTTRENASRWYAELAELRKPMACSVCAGTGTPLCGKPCICGGAGTEAEEIKGLRMELYKANEYGRNFRERAERLERDFAREQDIVIALRDDQLKLRAEIVELRSAAPPAFTITGARG
ncbi:MAG: hypothetical protein ACREBG_13255 [Pyrinomonadaceae bacterium]